MKKIIIGFLIIATIFLSGCAKLVDTKYEDVEIKIVDSYHRAMYTTPMKVGKVMSIITHPAIYHIMVEYNGIEYTINGSSTYYKYKDKVEQTAIGVLETRFYNDGSVKYNIIELK